MISAISMCLFWVLSVLCVEVTFLTILVLWKKKKRAVCCVFQVMWRMCRTNNEIINASDNLLINEIMVADYDLFGIVFSVILFCHRCVLFIMTVALFFTGWWSKTSSSLSSLSMLWVLVYLTHQVAPCTHGCTCKALVTSPVPGDLPPWRF